MILLAGISDSGKRSGGSNEIHGRCRRLRYICSTYTRCITASLWVSWLYVDDLKSESELHAVEMFSSLLPQEVISGPAFA